MIKDLNEVKELITVKELMEKLRISRVTLERWRRSEAYNFPKPAVVIARSPRWTKQSIIDWINNSGEEEDNNEE